MCSQAHAVRFEPRAIDKVVGDFADKHLTAVLGRPCITPIDSDSGRPCEEARWGASFVGTGDRPRAAQPRSQHAPGFERAGAHQLGELAIGGNIDGGSRSLQIGIAGEVAAVIHHQMDWFAVPAHKASLIPVVQTHPVLSAATGGDN